MDAAAGKAQDLDGTEPIEMGEGKKREREPVLPEDIDKLCKMNKDAMAVYAMKKFGIDVDLSSHLVIIRGDLVKKSQIALGQILADPETDPSLREAIEKVIPLFVKNIKTNRVFDASPSLLKRMDLQPCTKEGVPLRQGEYYIPAPKKSFRRDSRNEMERLASGMEDQIRT